MIENIKKRSNDLYRAALEANALIALVDGIGTGVVICPDQFSAEQQRYLVHQHIHALQALP
jgi:hypothetical protein